MKLSLLLVTLLFPAISWASCWEDAVEPYGFDPDLLKAMAWVESNGRPGATGVLLKDGNRAIGLMQVNTIHLPELSKQSITTKHLYDACVSLKVAARILAEDCVKRFGSTWKAIGCYNTGPFSKDEAAQQRYVAKVKKAYYGYKSEIITK